MSRKITWKRCVSVLIVLALAAGSMAGIGNQWAEAAARKTIRSVKIMQGGKNVTKKTLSMQIGSSKKLTVKAKTAMSQVTSTKKEIKYQSSNKKVVSVNENGKLQAKKYGSARITVTVSKKGYKTKKTWVKVSVKKETAQASTGTPNPTSAASTSSSGISGNTQVPAPTGIMGADTAAAPTGTPNTTEMPTAAPTEDPDSTVVPTTMPDVTLVPIPDDPKDPGSSTEEGKILVAYFSWSGTSERIAQNIISQTGADSFRIERETPYSDDYTTVAYGEAKVEADNNARPPLKDPLESVAAYDKIVLCYRRGGMICHKCYTVSLMNMICLEKPSSHLILPMAADSQEPLEPFRSWSRMQK